ncbi:MAG: hypothetical protein V1898_02410 [Patescibacteria group bacterium]
MKKIFLILPLLAILLFVGADCNKDNENNNNKNSNNNTNSNINGIAEKNNDFPELVLTDNQDLSTVDDGLYIITESNSSASDENGTTDTSDPSADNGNDISDEEWNDIKASKIMSEHYLIGDVSGSAKNLDNYLTGLEADLVAYIAVLQNGDVRGRGYIQYKDDLNECFIPKGEGALRCENRSHQNGSFRIYGNVMQTDLAVCEGDNNWPDGGYFLDVMFIMEDQPTEQVAYINIYTGGESSADNYNLHLMLHSRGPFVDSILACPTKYYKMGDSNDQPIRLNGPYSDGSMHLHFIDDMGQSDFSALRAQVVKEFNL